MEDNADVTRLARVVGVDSLDRTMENEDAEAKRFGEQYETPDGPGPRGGNSDEDDNQMRIVSAGDVTVHQHEGPEMPSVTPQVPSGKRTGSLAKLALGGALLASGAGIGAAIPWAMGAFEKTPPVPADSGYEYLGRVFDPGATP